MGLPHMIAAVIPLLVVAMLGYMFWHAAFRLRPDRVRFARNSDRRHRIFSRRHRARFLLGRAFDPPGDKPDWQEPLVADLAALDATPKQKGRPLAEPPLSE